MKQQIEHIHIDALIPYARNSRTHSDEQVAQIAASIKEFGFTSPVLIDGDGGIIAGHGRVMAARKLKLAEVPCIRLGHLTEAQRRAYVIADNRLALNSGWDDAMLRAELADLQSLDFDLQLLGFEDGELAGLLADPEIEEGEYQGDPDAAPEPPVDPVTKLGDVWVLGKHRVMCGDSTSVDAVDALMAGGKAGLVFTDPPYGVSFQSGMSKGGTATRFDVLANDDTILDVAPVVWQFMDDDTAAFIWTSHHVYPKWRNQFSDFYKQTVIWHKPGGGIGDLHGSYACDFEMALFCVKGRPMFSGKRGMAVWTVSKDGAATYVHPTQKPVELAERAIADFAGELCAVLDLFGGSGSTLIACEKAGRYARLMELDPRYCDVIVRRWQEFTGKTATLESDGRTFAEVAESQGPADA